MLYLLHMIDNVLRKIKLNKIYQKNKSYGSETQLDEVKEDVEEYELDITEDRW